MITEQHLNFAIAGVAIVAAFFYFATRGWDDKTLGPALSTGFSASQIPTGLILLAGQFGMVDPQELTKIMTSSMAGIWAGICLAGLGVVAVVQLFKRA